MDSLMARELLFKKMNGEASIHSSIVREAVLLLKEQRETIERYEKAIKVAMQNTHDDDTHEFLNRVLQGKENDAPHYRLKTD